MKHLPLHLRPLVTSYGDIPILVRVEDEQTKSGEPRVIPLPDVLAKMLETVKDKDGKVFDSTHYRKEWAKAGVAVGLGKLQPVDKNGNQRYTGLIIHDPVGRRFEISAMRVHLSRGYEGEWAQNKNCLRTLGHRRH